MTKHTPGPWMVTEGSDWTGMSGVSLGIDDAEGQDGMRDYHLATVVHGDPDELQANARLIAAAPDLLAALEDSIKKINQLAETANTLSHQLGLGRKVRAEDFTEKAVSAIARTKGQS